MPADRSDFLKSMYEQLFRDIAQQYTIVWQSAAALLSSFAIVALAQKDIVSLDIAISVISIICFWFLLNVVECSYWYNRNLCIIANIERQFLAERDLREIHYYFARHRPQNRMISHLKNQCFLGWLLLIIVLTYHFLERLLPALRDANIKSELSRFLPYFVSIIGSFYLRHRLRLREIAYDEFTTNSPGVVINDAEIAYGIGHGFKS